MLENGNWNCVSTQALSVILTGIVVVFMMLFLLIIVIKLVSLIVGGFQKMGKSRKENKPNKAAEKKTDKTAAPAASVTQKQSGTDGGVIAAISAAIAMMLGNQNFKITGVHKVKKADTRRNAWKMAGISENTRPF